MEADHYSLLARHAPTSIVSFGPGGDRTAADLLCDADAVARALPALASCDQRALLICEDRYRFAVCLLAAWQTGRVVALPPNRQPETIRRLVEQGSGALVLRDNNQLPGLDVRAVL